MTLPFAPHGPFENYHPDAPPPPSTIPFSPPPSASPPLPRPPKRAKEKSPLGRLTFFATLLAIGGLGLIDVAGAEVPGAAYFATALGVVGLGLVVGTWYGRGYKLIALGVLLSLGLGVAAVVGPAQSLVKDAGSREWAPQSVSAIQPEYSVKLGYGVLDLSKVNFVDHTVTTTVNAQWGNVRVILPPNVNLDVRLQTKSGDAKILGNSYSGNNAQTAITDPGLDGKLGDGKLIINLLVKYGRAEVTR
jgi:hypothetical protein